MELVSPFVEVPRSMWEHEDPSLRAVWHRTYYAVDSKLEGEHLAAAAIQMREPLFQKLNEISKRFVPVVSGYFQEYFAVDFDNRPSGYLVVISLLSLNFEATKPLLLEFAGEGSLDTRRALARALVSWAEHPGVKCNFQLENLLALVTPIFHSPA